MNDENEKKNESGHKDVSHLPNSSAEYQIEMARRQMARVPEWIYTGKRIDGSNLTKKDIARKGS
jgi:hypothetical protein